MGVDGLSDSLDTAVVVHRRHYLVEQVVPVRCQDVESENFAFDAPDLAAKGKTEITITGDFVHERLAEILTDDDLGKFVL